MESDPIQEFVDRVNAQSVPLLKNWLADLDSGRASEEDLLASVYAGMIVAYLYKFAPDRMAEDAKAASERLLALVADGVEPTVENEILP